MVRIQVFGYFLKNIHIIFADLSDQIQAALAHISDGICHALKVRVETILNAGTDLITLYAVSNLIRFYQNIINQVSNIYVLKYIHTYILFQFL